MKKEIDSFIEYMIKAKKTGRVIFRQTLIIFGCLIALMAVTFVFLILPPAALNLWPLFMAGVIYLAYRLIASLEVEYEYTLTNGELDVDKITNRKRRKRLITVHSKTFIEFGKADKQKDFADKDKEYARIIDASGHSEIFCDYYAVFFKNGQKIKLIFNPTGKMIDVFRFYAPRVVTEEDTEL